MGSNPVEVDGSTDLQTRSEITFLLLDGLKRQRPGGGTDVALCAVGLTRDGDPRPLMMRVVPAEEERAWRALLSELRTEGLGADLQLISADGHPALIKAIQASYPDTPLQICVAHRLLSLARKVDARWRSECLAGARKIFAAQDRVTAVGLFREWHTRWLKHGEPAVRTLEGDLASSLTFHRFPPHLWSRIRTVNLVERAFREARRRALPASPAASLGEPLGTGTEPAREEVSFPADDGEVGSGDDGVVGPADEPEGSGGDQEEQTVLVVPAASNGHVTPELIGDLTVIPDSPQPDADSEQPLEEISAPPSELEPENPAAVEMPHEGAEAPAGEPLAASNALEEPAGEAAWVDVSAPDEDTAVWGPIELTSDAEFDRRLAAQHRYTMQMRVAVTLTSAAGLMAGVVLAFIY